MNSLGILSSGSSGGQAAQAQVPQWVFEYYPEIISALTQTPQTANVSPRWATGAFAMPWFGQDAVTGQPLTNEQLQPQANTALLDRVVADQAAQQAPQQQAPVRQQSGGSDTFGLWQAMADEMNLRNATGEGFTPGGRVSPYDLMRHYSKRR